MEGKGRYQPIPLPISHLFVFTFSIASHDKSEMAGFIDSSVGYTHAHKQLKLIKTLNGISARFAKHCQGIKTQLDLRASSMYFSSRTHQPCVEKKKKKKVHRNLSNRLCTCNTNTHPLTPEDLKFFFSFFLFFVEGISFALQDPATLSPSESFLCSNI